MALQHVPFFQRTLLRWFSLHKRSLPWRRTHNPYRILVSEVMLQQTQVDRVQGYYRRFLRAFPTVQKLANAKLAQVLKLWSGLGYNRRALLLQRTAKVIVAQHHGKFPRTPEELLALPGIGPYTAGAVLAFAYNRDAVFADTNVVRVVERYAHGLKPLQKSKMVKLLHGVLPYGKSRNWYSALMDFGAAICTSRAPKCTVCPLHKYCKAAPQFLRGVAPRKQKLTTEKFEGSNRWWRGRILHHLTKRHAAPQQLYREIVSEHGKQDLRKFHVALSQLLREGLVRRKRQIISL